MTARQLATPLQRGPAILPALPGTFADYLNVLCGKGYLRGADAIKLMNAPSANYTATVTPTDGIDALSALAGTPALKVWLNQDVDPATTIFCTTLNYVYDTGLLANRRSVGQKARHHKERRRRGDLQGRPSRSCWLDLRYGIPEFSRR